MSVRHSGQLCLNMGITWEVKDLSPPPVFPLSCPSICMLCLHLHLSYVPILSTSVSLPIPHS
jgi:hypothetical protein